MSNVTIRVPKILYKKLFLLKEEAGFGDKSLLDYLNYIAKEMKLNPLMRDNIRDATKVLLPMWMCFTPNTNVICNPSVSKISNIKIGTPVLTHNGEFEKVTQVFQRHYRGPMIKIKRLNSNEIIEITPNHPILALKAIPCKHQRESTRFDMCRPTCKRTWCSDKPFKRYNLQWIPASQLTKNHILVVPRLQGNFSIPNICGIKLSPDFMRFIGYYLAEIQSNIITRITCYIYYFTLNNARIIRTYVYMWAYSFLKINS